MKLKRINEIIIILVSFILIIGMVCGIYFTFIKKGYKEINISNSTINISNEANFNDMNAIPVDIDIAKKMFKLNDEEFTIVTGRVPMLNSYSSMFVLIKSSPQYIDSVMEKVINYGNEYEKQWKPSENADQYELVKNRVIGKKDNIVYIIIAKDAKMLEELIK